MGCYVKKQYNDVFKVFADGASYNTVYSMTIGTIFLTDPRNENLKANKTKYIESKQRICALIYSVKELFSRSPFLLIFKAHNKFS